MRARVLIIRILRICVLRFNSSSGILIGDSGSYVDQETAISVGRDANATGFGATAVGYSAVALNEDSLSL